MKSRGVRVLLVVLAIAALAGAGAGVWQTEQRVAAARSAADAFERDARQAVVALGDWRAAQEAYVAEGQAAEAWLARASSLAEAIGPRLSALRAAAATAEAQASLESAIETFASLMQSDARARDYVKSGQRFSASDVIFTEAAPMTEKVALGIDAARGQENVAHAIAFEKLRRWELMALGASGAVALLVMLILAPIPRAGEPEAEAGVGGEMAPLPEQRGGLNLSRDIGDAEVHRAQPLPGEAPAQPVAPARGAEKPAAAVRLASELDAVADLCSSLARVQDTRELQGLLDRTARVLDATGVIVWMPDGPQSTLRPVLAHGYAPLTLSRMGIIHPAADNATATSFRTKSVVVVPAEDGASGAVVAPLISSEGCSGAMAVELREGVEPTSQIRAVATIVAAQLATMFTPGSVASASQAGAATRPGEGAAASRR